MRTLAVSHAQVDLTAPGITRSGLFKTGMAWLLPLAWAGCGGDGAQLPAADTVSPTWLAAEVISADEIHLSWAGAALQQSAIRIERKNQSGDSYAAQVIATPGATSFTDRGLAASTTYYYRAGQTGPAGTDEILPAEAAATTLAVGTLSTGQTKSYAADDDGSLQRGIRGPNPRFSGLDGNPPVSGDLVQDRLTGLIWTRVANAPGPDICLPGRRMNWGEATTYIGCLNSQRFSGYSDWRLPNRSELSSIIDYAQPAIAHWLNQQGFSSVQEMFWSSNRHTIDGSQHWYVWMQAEATGARNDRTYAVWPVRGSSSRIAKTGQMPTIDLTDPRHTDSGVTWPETRFRLAPQALTGLSGLILDRLSGLTWPQDAHASGPAACRPGARKSWLEALDYVACLNVNRFLGHTDWVLPNINELESLLNLGKTDQAAWLTGQGFVNVQNFAYWSSTRMSSAVNPFFWAISMTDGARGPGDLSNLLCVWPVRGIK